jgi:hypothetical protein
MSSLLWKIVYDTFQKKLENPEFQIQSTKDALQLLKEISEEKGTEFLKTLLQPKLLFEYIKYYGHHIPYGLTRPDGSTRPEALLAQELLMQLCALIPHYSKEALRSFCITMGHLFLLPYFSD